MNSRDEVMTIAKIAERADKMKLMYFDRLSLMMDIENVHEQFELRLSEFLESDDSNFTHDILGIQRNFNRRTMEMENFFLPRYAK